MQNISPKDKKNRLLWAAGLTLVYFCAVGLFFWLVQGDWQRESRQMTNATRSFGSEEIKAGDTVEQTFTPQMDSLERLTLNVNHWDDLPGMAVNVRLSREGRTLWEGSFPYAEIPLEGSFDCVFDPPLETGREQIRLTLTCSGSLSLWCGDMLNAGRFEVAADQGGELFVNGVLHYGQMVWTAQGYNAFHILEYFWPVACALYAALLALLILQLRNPGSRLYRAIQTVSRYQYLLKQLVLRDFRVKYQASVLGVLWSVLNPALMTLVYYFVFSAIFKTAIENFVVYLMSGIILFNYFSETTQLGLISVVNNANLITKVYIPKPIFPLTKALSSAINLCSSFLPLFILMVITGVPFHKCLLLIPLLLIFLMAFALGMGLILSAMYVFFRDTQFLWSVLVSVWNFLTPIFYPDTIIPARFMGLYRLNPLYHLCAFSRSITLGGAAPTPQTCLYCLLTSFGILAVGLFVYRKTQDQFCLYL